MARRKVQTAAEIAKNKALAELEPLHEIPVDEHDYTPNDFDLSFSDRFNVRNIYHPQSKYSVEKKVEAVSAYVVTGTSRMAAQACGIPEGTIRSWKSTACWWEEAYQAAKLRIDQRLESGLYKGLTNGIEILNQQMMTGKTVEIGTEEYMETDPDTGVSKKVRRKIFGKQEIPFKEMAVGWSILWDKLQLAQGKPTSRSEKIESPKEIMNQLKAELTEMSKAINAEKQINVVSSDEN